MAHSARVGAGDDPVPDAGPVPIAQIDGVLPVDLAGVDPFGAGAGVAELGHRPTTGLGVNGGTVRLDSVAGNRVHNREVRTHQVATQAGVNPQTLRYYERVGLLPAPPRTGAGYRDYPAEAVEVLRFIRRAKQLGFALPEIRELLGFGRHGPQACAAARALAEQRVVELERRISDLSRMREVLTALVTRCDHPGDEPEHECAVLKALDRP
jgi:DNA-binding transcriptional MerR regulator